MVRFTFIIVIVAGTIAAAVMGQCPPQDFDGDTTDMPQQVCDDYNGVQHLFEDAMDIIDGLIDTVVKLIAAIAALAGFQVGYVGVPCASIAGITNCLPNSKCGGIVGKCQCNNGMEAKPLSDGNNICVKAPASTCHSNADCDHGMMCLTVSGGHACGCPSGTTYNSTYGPYVDTKANVVVSGKCVCKGEHPNALYDAATGTCPCNGNAAFYNTTTLSCQAYTNAFTMNYDSPLQEFGYSMCPGDIIPNTVTHDCSCPEGQELGQSDGSHIIHCQNITNLVN